MNSDASTQVRILQRIIQEVIREKAKQIRKETPREQEEEKNPLALPLPPPKHVVRKSSFYFPQSPHQKSPFMQALPQKHLQGMQPSKFPQSRGALGRAMREQAKQPLQETPSQETEQGLEKLTPFLNDPTVQAVECQGPGQALQVHRSGRKQKTPLSLTGEDINQLLHMFSEKTNIPLNQGVFKATLGKLTLTAIVSEFVGTRFVLAKEGT